MSIIPDPENSCISSHVAQHISLDEASPIFLFQIRGGLSFSRRFNNRPFYRVSWLPSRIRDYVTATRIATRHTTRSFHLFRCFRGATIARESLSTKRGSVGRATIFTTRNVFARKTARESSDLFRLVPF